MLSPGGLQRMAVPFLASGVLMRRRTGGLEKQLMN